MKRGDQIKQKAVKLIPRHHHFDLNNLTNVNVQSPQPETQYYHYFISVIFPLHTPTQTPKESRGKPTCQFNLDTAPFRDPLTKPIFPLRLPFWRTANTLTHFLTEQMCNVTTSHSSAPALVVLCKCLSWIWWWIYFSIQLSSGTVKSITLYKADTESYFIRELWHYNLYQTHKMGGGGSQVLCSESSKHVADEISETVMVEKSKCAQLERTRRLHKSKGARKSWCKSKPSKTTLLPLAWGE